MKVLEGIKSDAATGVGHGDCVPPYFSTPSQRSAPKMKALAPHHLLIYTLEIKYS